MIKPEMVPKEVCLALKETLFSGPGHDIYATAIAVALNAWPGLATYLAGINGPYPYIILPLPQEKRDDER